LQIIIPARAGMRKFLLLLIVFAELQAAGQHLSKGLDYYLMQGLDNSPLLNDYKNQLNAAKSDSLLIRASQKPFVEARSQLQYFPVYNNFGYDEVITNGGNYTAVMGISQNIFNKRALDNRYRSVELQKQSIGVSSKLSSIDLGRMITDQYITSFAVLKDLEFNQSFLLLAQEEEILVKGFVTAGISKQTDYMALLVETQSQEIIVSQLKGQFRRELTTLNRICGLSDTAAVELEEPKLIAREIPDISQSPMMQQYNIDSIRIENEKAAIDIRYNPKINWYADAGFLSHNPWNFYNHFGYSAGLSLNIPVYDGRQRSIEKQKLTFSENSRKFYVDNYKKQYVQRIIQLNEELKTINETEAKMKDQLELSSQLVNALRKQLEAGIVNMSDYINSIRSYRNINHNLIMVSLQKMQVINEINYLSVQ
jgi:outer membrane protein TolC